MQLIYLVIIELTQIYSDGIDLEIIELSLDGEISYHGDNLVATSFQIPLTFCQMFSPQIQDKDFLFNIFIWLFGKVYVGSEMKLQLNYLRDI